MRFHGPSNQQLRYKYIKAKGEFHMNNPEMARALHQAVRNNEPLAYEESRVNNRENFQPGFCPYVFFLNCCGNLKLQIFSEVCRRMRFHGFRFQPKKSVSFETFSHGSWHFLPQLNSWRAYRFTCSPWLNYRYLRYYHEYLDEF